MACLPLARSAVYSPSKAALHSDTLSQRLMLRKSPVTVQEIAPPWIAADLIGQNDDQCVRISLAGTMEKLSSNDEAGVVEAAHAISDNPGTGEHKLADAFNAVPTAAPKPA